MSYGSNGLMLNLSASGARGKADGADTSYSNTQIKAGNSVTLQSGGDTTLKGAVIAANTVKAVGQARILCVLNRNESFLPSSLARKRHEPPSAPPRAQ